jgi:protein-S-isoprenylcysteine O-methyltransferase Ste14
MRNPIRLKNFRLRFLPYYAVGIVVLICSRPTPATFAAGSLVVLLGAALRGWSAGHLVKNHSLTVSGPYSRLRHPLYLGTLFVASGFAFIVGGAGTLVVLVGLIPWFFLLYLPRKERCESARLERLYGTVYAEYRERVPALLPSLVAWRPNAVSAQWLDADRRWSSSRYWENNELGAVLGVLVCLIAFALRTVGS